MLVHVLPILAKTVIQAHKSTFLYFSCLEIRFSVRGHFAQSGFIVSCFVAYCNMPTATRHKACRASLTASLIR